MIIKKSGEEIEKMARSGAILAATLDLMAESVRPGITTGELDRIAERFIRSQGAEPTFKGYRGFPGSICSSPNEMIVHGIPGSYKLAEGDIISIDVGVTSTAGSPTRRGRSRWGRSPRAIEDLLRATEAALHAGAAQCVPGNRMGDLSNAIQRTAEGAGLAVVRSLIGHGVGRSMHEDPQVPNYGKPGKGPMLEEGMVLAVEPMTTRGREAVRMGSDGWAIFSQDGSRAAHFEFTIAITADGPRILTPWHLPPEERTPAIVAGGVGSS